VIGSTVVVESIPTATETIPDLSQERNAYQVVTTPDGSRRIAVTTPLDAYRVDEPG